MANETGESTASIRRRADQEAWPMVEAALQEGAVLYRPTGLPGYYTRCKDDRDPKHHRGISAIFVKKLESEGKIVRVGVDTYAAPEVCA